MPADQDVAAALNGEFVNGGLRPWAFVKVRARTVLGNLKAKPFSRDIGGKQVAATTSAFDHLIGTAEQTSWRYVASDGQVWDMKDLLLVMIESFIENSGPEKLTELRAKAAELRPWPAGYAGRPDFE